MRKFLAEADEMIKWRLTEVKGVPSWSSSNGKVALLGDAVHGMTPYTGTYSYRYLPLDCHQMAGHRIAGQGSAMGIEDAAVLSHLLQTATPTSPLSPIMDRYEQVRRRRCEIVQYLASVQGRSWAAKDPARIDQRREMWRHANDNITGKDVKSDMNANYGSRAFARWVVTFDVAEACGEGEGARARL